LFNQGQHLGKGDFFDVKNEGERHFFSRSEILELFGDFEMLDWFSMTRQNMNSNQVVACIYHLGFRKLGVN
jgi:hypothetical protein